MRYSALLAALAAALGYGGWAVYVNYAHGMQAWAMAGALQGAYAFASTLSITHIARWVFFRYGCAYRGITAGFVASFIVMLAIPMMVHTVAGTPELWHTILPGLIWGSVYLLAFLCLLDRKNITISKNLEKE